jgi:DNA (cytosine-5)-methyltransferase 3A
MTTVIYEDETFDLKKELRYVNQNELEKLHNIPKGYTKNITYRQANDLIGDGWTVGIVEHIMSFLPQA